MVDIVDPYDKPSGGIVDPLDKSSKESSYTLPEDDTSAIKAFGKAAGESAVRTMFSIPGMIGGAKAGAALAPPLPGMGALVKPIAAVAGGLAGGIVSGMAYDKIKEFASDYIPQELADFVGLDKSTRQREQQQNPEATFAGSLTGGLVAFRPGKIPAIPLAGGKTLSATAQRGGMAALGAGQEAASQAMSDNPWQPSHIAAAALSGAVNAKPTKITKAVGGIFEPHVKTEDPGHGEWTTPKAEEGASISPKIDIPTTPTDKKGLDDGLFTLHKAKQADQVIGEKRMQAATDEGVTPEMREKWGKALEGEATLTPEEQKLWDKYGAPETAERKFLTEEIQKEGLVPPTNLEEDLTGKNVARIGIPKPKGFWEKLFGGDQGGLDPNVAKAPGAALERGFFVYEADNGTRTVIQATDRGITSWDNKKANYFGPKDNLPDGKLKAGVAYGTGKIKEATVSEIEKHTHMQYVKDQQAVQYQKLIELRDFYRTNMFLKNLRESPYFKGEPSQVQAITVDPNDPKSIAAAKLQMTKAMEATKGIAHKVVPGKENEIPEGFRAPEHLDKLPQFHGYVFEPRAAAIIEDFAKTWEPNALTWISSALIKNMMLNPYPHMNNEAWHWYLARGLSGWTTPKGIRSFADTFPKAMAEVMNQGPEMRDMMRNGASMLSTTTRTNAVHDAIFQKGVAEIKKNPAWHDNIVKIAEAIGKPVEAVYSGISKASSKAMWMVRDTMYMQMILEKESKGMDRKEAITEVERHMPSYRIPTHVGEGVLGEKLSRGLSKTLQNPNISIFSRYHHGMVKSQLETLKDVMAIKKGTAGFEEFKQGVDTMAAAAVAVAILYPALDLLAQAITGNKDAEQRRAGPFHVWDAMFKTAKGEKDAFSIAAGVFTFNPALLAIVQLMINQELYSGQHIWHTQDSGKQIAKDIGGYVAKQVPQVSTTLRVNSDRGGGMPQFLAQQADIKAPSKAAVEALKKRMHKEDVAAKKREQKRRAKENSN